MVTIIIIIINIIEDTKAYLEVVFQYTFSVRTSQRTYKYSYFQYRMT